MTDEEEVKLGAPMEPLSDAQVYNLARDIVTNLVYWPDFQTDWREIQMTFMVLALCPLDSIPSNAGAVYEYYTEAGPMSVNGRPTFFSCRFMPKESLPALQDEVERLSKALAPPEDTMTEILGDK